LLDDCQATDNSGRETEEDPSITGIGCYPAEPSRGCARLAPTGTTSLEWFP
jgi:hypothetical protein